MKKILYLLIIMLMITPMVGCKNKSVKVKPVTSVEIKIDNEGIGRDLTLILKYGNEEQFSSLELVNNTANVNYNEDVYKNMDLLDGVNMAMKQAVDNKLIDNKSNVVVNVTTPEVKETDLYRYIYKNILDSLNNNNIDIEVEYNFNE